jgi:hypothetical protein
VYKYREGKRKRGKKPLKVKVGLAFSWLTVQSSAFKFCLRICHQESPRESGRFEVEWDTSAVGLC